MSPSSGRASRPPKLQIERGYRAHLRWRATDRGQGTGLWVGRSGGGVRTMMVPPSARCTSPRRCNVTSPTYRRPRRPIARSGVARSSTGATPCPPMGPPAPRRPSSSSWGGGCGRRAHAMPTHEVRGIKPRIPSRSITPCWIDSGPSSGSTRTGSSPSGSASVPLGLGAGTRMITSPRQAQRSACPRPQRTQRTRLRKSMVETFEGSNSMAISCA